MDLFYQEAGADANGREGGLRKLLVRAVRVEKITFRRTGTAERVDFVVGAR